MPESMEFPHLILVMNVKMHTKHKKHHDKNQSHECKTCNRHEKHHNKIEDHEVKYAKSMKKPHDNDEGSSTLKNLISSVVKKITS